MPDENYARELLQLFTLGLVQLNHDGTPTLDTDGNAIELYSNEDITQLARVFTGLSFSGAPFGAELTDVPKEGFYTALTLYNEAHSMREKAFLGERIPPDTNGNESIRRALDIIFAHPNVGPFLAHQLIQRFVMIPVNSCVMCWS